MCYTRVGSGPTRKHQARLEKPARDKHSSLLQTFANYRCKKFYNIGSLWHVLQNSLLIPYRTKLVSHFMAKSLSFHRSHIRSSTRVGSSLARKQCPI